MLSSFRCFPESLNREGGNFHFYIDTDLVIIPIRVTFWPPKILGFDVNKPFIGYYACVGNGCYLLSAH